MKYIKLFVPLLISIITIILTGVYFEEQDGSSEIIIFIILKAGLLIYYLRLGNAGTTLINTLTLLLVSTAIGEYFLSTNATVGQIILIISYLAFGLIYFFRQKLKDKKDKLIKFKTTAVFIFVLTNILSVDSSMSRIPLGIGTIFLTFVYFYDRLTLEENSKKVAA